MSLSSPSPRRTELLRDQEKVTGTMTHVVVSTHVLWVYKVKLNTHMHICIHTDTHSHKHT